MDKKIRFTLTFKSGPTTVTEVVGKDRLVKHITLEDSTRVIEVEQWLERVLGLRAHVNTEYVEG